MVPKYFAFFKQRDHKNQLWSQITFFSKTIFENPKLDILKCPNILLDSFVSKVVLIY